MSGLEHELIYPDRPALLVVAAPKEALAVLAGIGGADSAERSFDRWEAIPIKPGLELLVTGVGKACAAGAVAAIFDPARHGAILSTGIAGALQGAESPKLLDVVIANPSVYADEGIDTPTGFQDVASMGFSPAPPGLESLGLAVPTDQRLLTLFTPIADQVGPIATVSTCAGTDTIADEVVRRTGAIAEAMEGAAVGFTALSLSNGKRTHHVPFIEIRVISNTTGDRSRQRWDLDGALARLSVVSGALAAALGC